MFFIPENTVKFDVKLFRCVILLRAVEYTAESLSSFCSQSISRKMAGRNLGDVIANERHPSSEIPQPTSSFDENG